MVRSRRPLGAEVLSAPEASARFDRAIAAIDLANSDDPNQIEVRGVLRPKELAHAELAGEWVGKLVASPSEALLLAARAHHLRRWAIARSEYPEGRVGYHRWRRALQHLHAREVAAILAAEDYDAETIARVEGLVLKRGLGREEEVQVLEDALCLVFLETQLHDLSARYDDEKIVDILRKSLRKMSAAGIAAAGEISLEQRDASMLERAVLLEQG